MLAHVETLKYYLDRTKRRVVTPVFSQTLATDSTPTDQRKTGILVLDAKQLVVLSIALANRRA